MFDTVKAKSYVPSVYKGFVEMDAIVNTDDSLLDIAEEELKALIDNQFILTARESGIAEWENLLNIIADPIAEDLEFRRSRIINRISNRVPFTKIWLKQKLDSIIGAENYVLTIDNNEYIIYLESSATNQIWYSEILMTMNSVKPCNMKFVNTPFINSGINVEETINYTEKIFNYTLGSGFQLGMRPFVTHRDEVLIKLPTTKSIQSAFVTDIASFAASDIASVLINDSVVITDFTLKQASGNSVTITYEVTSAQATEVTNVKLRNSSGAVLTSSTVYVPVSSAALMKHTILVKEG